MKLNDILGELGVDLGQWKGDALTARSPLDGATLAGLAVDTPADAARKIDAAHAAFLKWRTVPAPQRGELVRVFGNVLREHKAALGSLVTLEAGKVTVRRPGRSAGNDRHLRFRRWPVAPALRPDDRFRASGSPHDGNVASAGCGRRDFGVQLPGRGVVVEYGAGAGLR